MKKHHRRQPDNLTPAGWLEVASLLEQSAEAVVTIAADASLLAAVRSLSEQEAGKFARELLKEALACRAAAPRQPRAVQLNVTCDTGISAAGGKPRGRGQSFMNAPPRGTRLWRTRR